MTKKIFTQVFFSCFYILFVLFSCSKSKVIDRTSTAGVIAEGAYYTNLDPDDTVYNSLNKNTLNVDIDEDGISDFAFLVEEKGKPTNLNYQIGVYIKSLNGGQVCVVDSVWDGTVSPLNNGDKISGWLKWNMNDKAKLAEYRKLALPDAINDSVAIWNGLNDRYIGIRLVYNKDTLYGWVGVKVIGYNKLIIKDFSVNRKLSFFF